MERNETEEKETGEERGGMKEEPTANGRNEGKRLWEGKTETGIGNVQHVFVYRDNYST